MKMRPTCPSRFTLTSEAVVELYTVLGTSRVTWVRQTLVDVTLTVFTHKARWTLTLVMANLMQENKDKNELTSNMTTL